MIKKSQTLLFYFDNSQFVGENYLSGKLTILNSSVIELINILENFQKIESIISKLSHIPDIKDLINSLLERDILISYDSKLHSQEKTLETWEWGLAAKYFHLKTNRTSFEANNEYILEKLDNKALTVSPPSPYLKLDGINYIKLKPYQNKLDRCLSDVLFSRRTCRSFIKKPITETELSTLLFYCFGKIDEYKGGSLGDVIFKTSPSGGSRHPTETYIVVNNVENIEAGLYHYCVENHSIGLIKKDDFSEWGIKICSNQEWVKDASVLFVLTSLLKRNMWKYENSHAYRVINMDIGHLGQTFHLVCTSLELGPFTTAALNNEEIQKKIKINPLIQPAFYVCATGYKGRE